jgi:quercetin dioxygenase-like cupin family protein
MALPHAAAGDIIDLRPYGEHLPHRPSTALFKSAWLEVLRMVLPAGRSVPQHHVAEELTVQCLEGDVEFQVGEKLHILQPQQMLCMAPNTPYAMRALSNASLLLTFVRRQELHAKNS